jgi:hypothetical protein
MNNKLILPALLALLLAPACRTVAADTKADKWKETIRTDDTSFSSTGRNPYWILEPGYQLVLDGKEDKKAVHLVITVLNETKKVDGVETRIVEERESADGELVEISRNYFAVGNQTHNLYYFGEDVDMYKNGKITNHEGSWLSGTEGAKYGVMLPGDVKIGDKYYQEKAPGKALDRGENVSTSIKLETPAGKFKNCLKVKETTPLEPDNTEYKVYAPGIGIVQEGRLKLVKYGPAK